MTNYIDIDEGEAKKLLHEMPHTGAGKKPLFSQIMVGYMLSKAVWFFNFFIDKAVSCIDQSIIDMNSDGVPTDNLEAYEIKALLRESQASVLNLVSKAHMQSAEKMTEKGYGTITTFIYKYLKVGIVSR